MNKKKLDAVQKVYRFWGNYPLMYVAQDYITFMGRPQLLRREAVNALNLKKGDTVLEVACGTGRNFSYYRGKNMFYPKGGRISHVCKEMPLN